MKLVMLMLTNIPSDITSIPIFGHLETVQVFQTQKLLQLFSPKLKFLSSNFHLILRNLTEVLKNPNATKLPAKHEGYTSCPLFVGDDKLMLAEFKYDGAIDETFYNDQ